MYPMIIPILAGAMLLVVGWLDGPRGARRGLGRLATRTGLAIDPPTAELVHRRLRRRIRAATAGGGLGLALGTIPAFVTGSYTDTIVWCVAADILGAGIGALTVHVVDSGRAAGEPGTRAAVLRPRQLRDFLLPVEVAAPFLALLLPLLAAALALVGIRTATQPIRLDVLAIGVGVALAVTLAATLAQRLVLHMAPPADSSMRLKWEDALRSVALRDIGITSYAASYLLSGLVTFNATDLLASAPGMAVASAVVFVGATIALAGLALAAEAVTSPARRFLRLYDQAPTVGAR